MQPGAIAQRFNLRRVELTDWGQPPEMEWRLALPSQEASPQFPTVLAKYSANQDSPSSGSQSPYSLTEHHTVLPVRFQSTMQSVSPVSTPVSPERTIAFPKSSVQLSHSERSVTHDSFNSQTSLKTSSISPEFDQTVARKVQSDHQSDYQSASPSGELDQPSTAAFQVRRGGSHSPAKRDSSNSAVAASAEAGTNALVLSRSASQSRTASPQSSSKTGDRATRAESLQSSLETGDHGTHPTMPPLEMPMQSVRVQTSAIRFDTHVLHSEQPNSAPESQLALPIKVKPSRLQSTAETTNSLLPISVKVKSSRSQPTPEVTSASLPALVSVKPQQRLTMPSTATETSPELPLIQRHLPPLHSGVMEETTAVSPPTANHQPQPIPSAPSAAPAEPVNISKVAEEVSRLLSRRLMIERERRGIRP